MLEWDDGALWDVTEMSVKMSADTADLLYAVPEAVQFCFCVPDLRNHRNTETHTFYSPGDTNYFVYVVFLHRFSSTV